MNSNIRCIAVDLDGTLLNSNHQVNPRTAEVLRQAVQNGLTVIIATGKTRASSEAVIQELGLNTPGVYSQGLTIVNADGSINRITYLEDDTSSDILKFAIERQISFVAYQDVRLFTDQLDMRNRVSEDYDEPLAIEKENLKGLLEELPLQKFILFDEPEKLDALRPELEARFGGRADLVRSQMTMLELVPPHTSKGWGLKSLLDQLDIPFEQVIAFGDGENDLEMIEMAGIGVAMGNAMPRLKSVADRVTMTNDEDGIAAVLEELLFSN